MPKITDIGVDHEGVYSGSAVHELGRPEKDVRIRLCKICKGRLSIYNLNKYCFAHMSKGQRKEDEQEAERLRKYNKKQSEQRKKRISRKT